MLRRLRLLALPRPSAVLPACCRALRPLRLPSTPFRLPARLVPHPHPCAHPFLSSAVGLTSLGLTALAALPGRIAAAELLVEPGGGGSFPTIQEAIDAALPGDVVVLADGTFTGIRNVDLDFRGKDLVLRSQSGTPESCVIDAGFGGSVPHRVLVFQSGETPLASVEGITLTRGTASGASGLSGAGGAVLCANESHPSFRNCVFRDNAASSDGGAISCRDSSPKLYDCRFEGNVASFGGAFFAERPCLLTGGPMEAPPILLEGCVFEGNEATQGGAIYARGIHTRVLMREVSFVANVGDQGGGVKLHGATAVVEGCRFEDNWAGLEGGGLACESTLFCSPAVGADEDSVEVTVSTTLFCRNAAGVGGAALFRGYSASFDHCTLADNAAPLGSGVAALSHYPVDPFLPSDLLVETTILAFGAGGASVHEDSASTVRLVCSDIFGNEGGDWVESIEEQGSLDGNMNVDPLFCNPETGDYELRTDSPCQDYPGGCGLIGAFPATCGTSSMADAGWEVADEGRIGLRLGSPFRENLRGQLVLAESGDVVLELFDAQGRCLASRAIGRVDAGGHPIEWSPRDGALVAGSYFVLARAGREQTTRKVVRIR